MTKRAGLVLLLLALPAAAVVVTVQTAWSERERGRMPDLVFPNHPPRFSFQVIAGDEDLGMFKNVEGLSIEQEVTEFRSGDEGDVLVRKLPGRVKYGDITLKRGYTTESTLNDWIEASARGEFTRKNMSIILFDNSDPRSETEIKRWNCFETFPRSWKLSTLDGKGNDVLTEEMVIVIEYFEEA